MAVISSCALKVLIKARSALNLRFFEKLVTMSTFKLIVSVSTCSIVLFYWLLRSLSNLSYCELYHTCTPMVEMKERYELWSDDSKQCEIPKLPIMPNALKKQWKPKPMDNCDHIPSMIQHATVDTPSRLLPNVSSNCCVQEILRGDSDSKYSLSHCQNIQPGAELPQNFESMFVNCGNGVNAEANVPLKSSVQEKLKHWELMKEKPVSVFIFGFDSVSRSHAYRSLPKSMDLMKRLGFVDFSGYHSLAPSTLTNFMALLMGLPRPTVRGTCAPDWTSAFDSCPFIWKNFSGANYVTGYFEDGDQSFNWGGQSGFVKQPVDYYLHHLFLALHEQRTKMFDAVLQRNPDCTSRETIPEFLLRHSQRFLKRFSSVPFFALTWWAYPFHEDMFVLPDFDTKFASFIEFISKSPELLRRTLFIFLSDHGDRMNFFNGKSVESYIERGLPPLLVRMPEMLSKKYPSLKKVFMENVENLITPFDLHHTMLHVLSLNGNIKFPPVLTDRSSLFTKMESNRSCADTNIPLSNCVCNVEYKQQNHSTDNLKQQIVRDLSPQALQFAIGKLNLRVQRSKYSKLCEVWWAKTSDILYTRLIGQERDFILIVLAFVARPGDARFEVRMKIKPGLSQHEAEVSGFSRINRYGDQSWCVGTTTDSDKEMREMCVCKNVKPK